MASDSSPPAPVPTVSLIVPTFNEAANIDELLDSVCAAFPTGLEIEVLFVDDSTDDTPEVVERAAARCPMPVSVLHREVAEGGLGGAVVAGIARTSAPWIVVMDADLQHPPHLVPQLVKAGEHAAAELVVASRYAEGGGRDGLAGGYRTAVSGASTALTKALFPRLLRGVSDPMSGFFAIRREAIDRAVREAETRQEGGLRPLGYKILLELAVRCRPRGVVEVPYAFGERFAGESKSTVREGLRFLRHLADLRTSDKSARMVAFGLIGVSGLVPNLLALWVLTGATSLHYAVAEVLANQLGVLWNFALLEFLVYRSGKPGRGARRLLGFAVLSNADLLARIPLMMLLVERAGLGPVTATVISLVVVFVVRFLLVDTLVYRRRRTAAERAASPPAAGVRDRHAA
ncbi:dolichol monophosphate mannose synthase [Streptomyces inusitatus]|uniref:Dolichol monophosphate mannose synthase n=1 Tax=Streptomyces inusitatus TaxID=68221 RepID=A0A918PXR1_9ACTN|nr:glycosyltransferase [Streptomyces inusitatus]GGZ26480.1 dolichol monophosphate mannose synthase [Streptomyces inusitatus]